MMKDGKQNQLIIYNDELRKKLKEIDIKLVQQMFSGIRKQLRKIDHMKLVYRTRIHVFQFDIRNKNLKLHI